MTVLKFIIFCCVPLSLATSANSQVQDLPGNMKEEEKVLSKKDKEIAEFQAWLNEASLTQLFDEISKSDSRIDRFLFAAGHSGVFGGNTPMLAILADIRVGKILSLLEKMPRQEAQAKIVEIFEIKFNDYQKKWKEDKGAEFSFDQHQSYHGLLAMLFLSGQICEHDVFVGHYRRWLNWYRKEQPLMKKRFESAKESEAPHIEIITLRSKSLDFSKYGPPDRLAFISICANRARARGVEFNEIESWVNELSEASVFKEKHPELEKLNMPKWDSERGCYSGLSEVLGFRSDYVGWALFMEESKWDAKTVGDLVDFEAHRDKLDSIAISWSKPNLIQEASKRIIELTRQWFEERFDKQEPDS